VGIFIILWRAAVWQAPRVCLSIEACPTRATTTHSDWSGDRGGRREQDTLSNSLVFGAQTLSASHRGRTFSSMKLEDVPCVNRPVNSECFEKDHGKRSSMLRSWLRQAIDGLHNSGDYAQFFDKSLWRLWQVLGYRYWFRMWGSRWSRGPITGCLSTGSARDGGNLTKVA
jgi:hypothetical protein